MPRFLQTSFAIFLLLLVGAAWAQTANDPQATPNAQDAQPPSSGAVPAMGQAPSQSQSPEFPPLSGLDEPSLEPNSSSRSFLLVGAQASETADTNARNSLGTHGAITGITHLLGTAALQRMWSRYQASLTYAGGGAIYGGGYRADSQVHSLSLDTRYLWRTGAMTFRDRASYLPEGSFGGTFGGAGGSFGGFGGLGGTGSGSGQPGLGGGDRFLFFGHGILGGLATVPRLDNLAIVDIQQSLSPRSSITMAGGFNFLHFTKSSGGLLIDTQQVTGHAGYNYAITRKDMVAVAYGYQHFHFPQAGGAGFETHVFQAMYGHRISGRMDVLLSAGPQLTQFKSPTQGTTLRMSGAGRLSLRYRFPRTMLSTTYDHYTSAASGFFAGANTDVVLFAVSRPLSARWTALADGGYANYRRLQQISLGVPASAYQTAHAGARLSYLFSRNVHGFLSYRFTDMIFNSSFCAGSAGCGRISNRHAVSIGLAWYSRPIRLD